MKMNPRSYEAYSLMHDGILALSRAEQAGLRVNLEYIEDKKAHLTRRIERLENKFKETNFFKHWQHTTKSKVNINSNAQLAAFLYRVKKLTPAKTTESGQGATDEEALKQLNIPELNDLLDMRKLKKVRDTYLDAFAREQVGGYLHPFFNLHLVRTFRSSSDSPNFQNIPKRDEEAMQICRRALYPRPGHQLLEIDFSGIEVRINSCVVGSTMIETLQGSISIKELIQKLTKQSMFVYGYNKDKTRIAVGKVTSGGITGHKKEVWKVLLDNNRYILVTPDHLFLLRDGEYKPVKELKQGDSLMPFYKKRRKSHYKTVYEKIYLNNGSSILSHNLVAEDVYGITIKGSGKVIHHIDGNGCNNHPDNLSPMSRAEHMSIHSKQGWKNSDNIKRTTNSWTKTEEGRKFAREAARKRQMNWGVAEWNEFGRKVSASIKRNGGRAGEKNSMFGRKHSKEAKEKNRITHLGISTGRSWNKGLTKETSPIIKKMAENKKGKPGHRKKGDYVASEETRLKLSAHFMGRSFSNETRKKIAVRKKEYWDKYKSEGNKETCKVCNKQFITLSSHLHYKHGITKQEHKKYYNHRVKRIEFYGYEDVYNINVEGLHNYATSAGVIIKNCYNKDSNLIKYIKDPKSDMHADMAKQIFIVDQFDKSNPYHYTLRQAAKNGFVFPEFYGDYYKNCAENMACGWGKLPSGKWQRGQGIPMDTAEFTLGDHLIAKGSNSLDKFTDHIKKIEKDFWTNRFNEYAEWKDRWWKLYQKYGYIDLLTGFRCSGVMSRNEVLNIPAQGSAFHCLLWSFIQMDHEMKRQKWNSRLIGQIHDSMILDVHPDELQTVIDTAKRITTKDLLDNWKWIIVPMDIEAELAPVDGSWAEKTKYKI